MKLFILSILLFVYTITLAQPDSQWKNYTDYGTIYNAVKYNQTIWGATQGGLLKIDMQTKNQFCYNRANANLPNNAVRSLDVDTNGNVWFVTYSQWVGVSKFDGWAVYNYTEDNSPIKNGTATAVGAGRNNNIWVACGSGSLFMFDGSIWTNYQIPWDTIYNNSDIRKIVFDSENNIWCLTGHILIKYDGVSWNLYNIYDIDSTVGWISGFRDITVGNDSSVWVTSDKAVMEYRNNQWRYYQNSFINNCSNHAITIDDNNVKWVVGTSVMSMLN